MSDASPAAVQRLDDTWACRDLPVLVEVAGIADKLDTVQPSRVAAATGLDDHDVLAAIQALVHAGYLHENRSKLGLNGSGDIYVVMPGWLIPSERGRRAVGLWPSEETALDRMVEKLRAIAEDAEADEETRSRARRILDNILAGGREIGLAVASAMITGQVT